MSLKARRGNAFLITLVSVVLLGAVTFVLSRQIGGTQAQNIAPEKAELYANQIIAHAEAMKMVLQQMQSLGVKPEEVSFEKSSSGTFNSGDVAKKVYHPAGGGLTLPPDPSADFYKTGYGMAFVNWQYQNVTNVEWTPSTATDIIYSISGLRDDVCAAINKKITGSTAIPVVSLNVGGKLVYVTSGNSNFMASNCTACNGLPMLCIQKDNTGTNTFYSIVLGR